MSSLFRSAALARISNPDQLDRVLQVVRPMHLLGIAAIALILAAGFVWSVLSTAPVKVQGQGILLSVEGVADVTAPNTGRVEQILARQGEAVEAGAIVALLNRPAAFDAVISAL
jgi:HlyD family secretion protein